MKVEVKCRGATVSPLKDLKDFQSAFIVLDKENYQKLKSQIVEEGFSFPFAVWVNTEGKNILLDGHQRRRALLKMKKEGFEIPDLPIDLVEADSLEQAKRKLLSAASQFGKPTESGLASFALPANISFHDIKDGFDIPGIDMESLAKAMPTEGKKEPKNPEDVAGSDRLWMYVEFENEKEYQRCAKLLLDKNKRKIVTSTLMDLLFK